MMDDTERGIDLTDSGDPSDEEAMHKRALEAIDHLRSSERVVADLTSRLTALGQVAREHEQRARDARVHADDASAKMREAETQRIAAEQALGRRVAEIAEMQSTIERLRREQITADAAHVSEREAANERHATAMAGARAELGDLRAEIADLTHELARERQRTTADGHLVGLLTDREATIVIDGEALGAVAWPGRDRNDRRSRLIEALERYGRRHGLDVELLLGSTEGWDTDLAHGSPIRIRVPSEGNSIDTVVDQLAGYHRDNGRRAVIVSSRAATEPWVDARRAGHLFGLPVARAEYADDRTDRDRL